MSVGEGNHGDGGAVDFVAGDTSGKDGSGGYMTFQAGSSMSSDGAHGGRIEVTAGHTQGVDNTDTGGSVSIAAGNSNIGFGGFHWVRSNLCSCTKYSGNCIPLGTHFKWCKPD